MMILSGTESLRWSFLVKAEWEEEMKRKGVES